MVWESIPHSSSMGRGSKVYTRSQTSDADMKEFQVWSAFEDEMNKKLRFRVFRVLDILVRRP